MLPATFVFARAFNLPPDDGTWTRRSPGVVATKEHGPTLELMKISRPREQIAEERGLIT